MTLDIEEYRILKFILDVLATQEKDFRRRNQLVQDSMIRTDKEKVRYAKDYQKYLDAIEYIKKLL